MKSKAGWDGMNYELELLGVGNEKYLEQTWLNHDGIEYAFVEVKRGMLFVYINAPMIIRKDNIQPFTLLDAIKIEIIRSNLIRDLQSLLDANCIQCDVSRSCLKKIESNITQKVAGASTCGQVLNLLNRSCYDNTNVVYQGAARKCKYLKDDQTLIVNSIKKNYYRLKCYNKSLKEWKKGNKDVEPNLLRIETIMQLRTIRKLFGDKATLYDVFQKQGLEKVIREHRRIFVDEVVEKRVVPCLNAIRDLLFESLTQTGRPIETIALLKELIVDELVFRQALKKWYKFRGMSVDRASRNAD